ncbi:hypothetical protein GCM10028801_36870 [Nocardioides maradonensis]
MAAGKRAARPEPKRRATPPSGRHRAVKPRYGRIVAASIAAVVTLVAVVGGFGWLPHGGSPSAAAARQAAAQVRQPTPPATTPSSSPSTTASTSVTPRTTQARTVVPSTALPADSGSGRRVVFSQSEQRVWLVNHNDDVRRTYLVSGSVTDNLQPGTYQVYSRSRWAVGVDDSGTMQYFVRFTHGPTGAAIGFHTIPQKDGQPLQTASQLGTPQSHGCIRQATPDAIALWDFAPEGTTVVVTP